jgi:hypothetical protein
MSHLLLDLRKNCEVMLRATDADTVLTAKIPAVVSGDLRPSAECKIVSVGTVVSPEASSGRSTPCVGLINNQPSVVLVCDSGNLIDQTVAHALTSGPVDWFDKNSGDRLGRSLTLNRASDSVEDL